MSREEGLHPAQERGREMTRRCNDCGQMKPREEYVHSRARCKDCWNVYRRTWFHREGEAQQADRARSYANQKKHQEATVKQATKAGAAWGQEQDRVILENWDKPIVEVAATLSRTYLSISNRKKKLKRWGMAPTEHAEAAK